jgi:hypothetical protein
MPPASGAMATCRLVKRSLKASLIAPPALALTNLLIDAQVECTSHPTTVVTRRHNASTDQPIDCA